MMVRPTQRRESCVNFLARYLIIARKTAALEWHEILGVECSEGEWIAFLDARPKELFERQDRTPQKTARSHQYGFQRRPFPYPSTVLLKREVFLKAGGFCPLFAP
jgi:hypothetical protein